LLQSQRIKMMKLVLLSACVAAASAKIFVFKADQCNTNFDDPTNWQNMDDKVSVSNPMSTIPSEISFGDASGKFESVDVRIPAGDYKMGTIVLQDNMVLSLDKDGVSMTISGDADGPKARFIAGQSTEKGECSVGCNKNFYVYDGKKKDAVAVDLSKLREGANLVLPKEMTNADVAPCGSDIVVIPDGYNVNLLAMGFHAFRSVVYTSGDEVIEAKATAQMPQFSLFPVDNMRLFFGDSVIDQCKANGMMDSKTDTCVCASECPSTDSIALADAHKIRMAAKAHATKQLADYQNGDGKNGDGYDDTLAIDYSFSGAYPAEQASVDCEISGKSFKAALETFYNKQAKIKGGKVTVDTTLRSITITGTAEAEGGLLRGQAGSFEGPIKIGTPGEAGPNSTKAAPSDPVDVSGNADASFAMGVYYALVSGLQADCGMTKADGEAALKAAGIEQVEEEVSAVFGGNNLPQIDVNRLVDPNNKDGIVTAVHEALKDAQSWTGLNKDVMLDGWRLANPEEVHKGRRAAPARMGLATSLVHVKLEYSRWSTAAGINKKVVQDVVNWVFANYDTKTHHKCFTFTAGFDDECIIDIVKEIIKTQLGACSNKDAEDCRKAAFEKALEQIMIIKGCGLLGSTGEGASKKCIDPEAEKRVRAEATKTADAAVAAAVTSNLKAHADAVEQQRLREVAFNATRAAKLAVQATGTENAKAKARTAAKEAAAGKTAGEVQPLHDAAKTEMEAAEAALKKATRAYDKCHKDSTNTNASIAICVAEEKALFKANKAFEVANAKFQVYKNKLDDLTLTPEQLKAKQDALKKQAGNVQEEVKKTKKTLENKKAEYAEKCGADATATGCPPLKTEVDTLTALLKALEAKLAALESSANSNPVGGDEEKKEEDSGGGMMMIIIIVVVLLIVIGGVAAYALTRGGGDANAKGAGDRTVVAFANPMYDDPNSGGGGGNAAPYEEGKDDQGLYDEPSFQENSADKSNPMYASNEDVSAGAGYLDVQPDDDDDDDDEESSSEDDE